MPEAMAVAAAEAAAAVDDIEGVAALGEPKMPPARTGVDMQDIGVAGQSTSVLSAVKIGFGRHLHGVRC
jgi:hypothetical protein